MQWHKTSPKYLRNLKFTEQRCQYIADGFTNEAIIRKEGSKVFQLQFFFLLRNDIQIFIRAEVKKKFSFSQQIHSFISIQPLRPG